MSDSKVEKVLEYIYKLVLKENDIALSAVINQFYSIPLESISTEGKVFKSLLIASQKKVIESNPNYYQGLIFLAFAYYEVKEYEKSYEFTQRALKLLQSPGLENSYWTPVASEIAKGSQYLGGASSFLGRIKDILVYIKKNEAEKLGYTLLCSKCGNYAPPKSKFCLQCGYEFTKKDLKPAKK